MYSICKIRFTYDICVEQADSEAFAVPWSCVVILRSSCGRPFRNRFGGNRDNRGIGYDTFHTMVLLGHRLTAWRMEALQTRDVVEKRLPSISNLRVCLDDLFRESSILGQSFGFLLTIPT